MSTPDGKPPGAPVELGNPDSQIQGLCLGQGEQITSTIEGGRKKRIFLLEIIKTIITFGMYLCCCKTDATKTLVCTNFRVIEYSKLIIGGDVMESTQRAFFHANLSYGRHIYEQSKYSLCERLTCEPIWDKLCCRKRKPKNLLKLRFCKYGTSVQEEQLALAAAAGGDSIFDLFPLNLIFGGPSPALADLALPSVGEVEVLIKHSFDDSMPIMTAFLGGVLEYYPYMKQCNAAPRPENFTYIDDGGEATAEVVGIDRRLLAFGQNETVINAVPQTPPMNCIQAVAHCILSVMTCYIFHWCYLHRLPYFQSDVYLSDRRLIQVDQVKRGKLGTVQSKNFTQTVQFWMLNDVYSGGLSKLKPCCAPCNGCCGACLPTIDIILKTVNGVKFIHPTMKGIPSERIEAFFQDLTSCDSRELLSGQGGNLPDDLDFEHLYLTAGEKLLAAQEARRYMLNMVIRVLCLIGTCCIFPPKMEGTLCLTNKRLIELATKTVRLNSAKTEISYYYWMLDSLTYVQFSENKPRYCGCKRGKVSISVSMSRDPTMLDVDFHIILGKGGDPATQTAVARSFVSQLSQQTLSFAVMKKNAASFLAGT